MTEFRWTPKAPLKFPEDLRSWVDEQALLGLVYEAWHSIEHATDPGGKALLGPGSPRVLLTLLTYSYAVGLFASDEIECRLRRDPQLLYLAANIPITSNRLRNFRRCHRALLQQTLSRLLQLTWEHRISSLSQSLPPSAAAGAGDCPAGLELAALFNRAAEHRVQQAVHADSMALDN